MEPPLGLFELHTTILEGVVVYLNGLEVLRHDVPTGTARDWTPAVASVDGSAVCLTNELADTNFVSGQNILAAEVHASQSGFSGAVFGASLSAVGTTNYTIAPTLHIAPVDDRALLSWSGPGFVLECAGELPGPWSEVEVVGNQFFAPLSVARQRFCRLREK